MEVRGRRKRGRPNRRWSNKVKDDIKEKGLSADEVYDRATWRRMSSTPHKSENKIKRKKKITFPAQWKWQCPISNYEYSDILTSSHL